MNNRGLSPFAESAEQKGTDPFGLPNSLQPTMLTFENDQYKWRETYFVLFDSAKQPTLARLSKALLALNPRFELSNAVADDDGKFESLTLHSPQDYAAMDISYLTGEEVQQQVEQLVEELRGTASDADERAKIARLAQYDGRLDILHFEQVVPGEGGGGDEEGEELLDPRRAAQCARHARAAYRRSRHRPAIRHGDVTRCHCRLVQQCSEQSTLAVSRREAVRAATFASRPFSPSPSVWPPA